MSLIKSDNTILALARKISDTILFVTYGYTARTGCSANTCVLDRKNREGLCHYSTL